MELGCNEEELIRRHGEWPAIAALAVNGKTRLMHDGAREIAGNSRIRCRDRQRIPRPNEKNFLLRYFRERRELRSSLVCVYAYRYMYVYVYVCLSACM